MMNVVDYLSVCFDIVRSVFFSAYSNSGDWA